jgi:hypothetical protein
MFKGKKDKEKEKEKDHLGSKKDVKSPISSPSTSSVLRKLSNQTPQKPAPEPEIIPDDATLDKLLEETMVLILKF